MWKWLLGGGAVVTAIVLATRKSEAAPTTSTQFLQFQALFKVALANDLKAGAQPLPANVTVDGLASTYAQGYVLATKEQLASMITDARSRGYTQTAGILAMRPT